MNRTDMEVVSRRKVVDAIKTVMKVRCLQLECVRVLHEVLLI